MKADAVIYTVAGVVFGLIVGWLLGVQQAERIAPRPPAAQAAPSPQAQGGTGQSDTASGDAAAATSRRATPLDTARAEALEARATASPGDAAVRAELGNLYFDADRFEEAARWYEASLQIDPKDPDVSTDLGICYFYMKQAPRAIRQFEQSLALDPRHTKTLLNLGLVRAFGTQDLEGAADAWQQVLAIAPAASPEARAARQALEGLRAAHPDLVPNLPSSPEGT